MSDKIDKGFLTRRLAALDALEDAVDSQIESNPVTKDGDGGGTRFVSTERFAKLEEAVDGLKRVQGYTFNLMAIIVALVMGLTGIVLVRMSQLETKVDDLPGKIRGDLQTLTTTLAASITAAKQVPPQVLLVPAPSPQNQKPH